MTARRALPIVYAIAGLAALVAAVIVYVRRGEVDWLTGVIGVLLLAMGVARWRRAAAPDGAAR